MDDDCFGGGWGSSFSCLKWWGVSGMDGMVVMRFLINGGKKEQGGGI